MNKILSEKSIRMILNMIAIGDVEYDDFTQLLIRISETERLSLRQKDCEDFMESEVIFTEITYDLGSNKMILNNDIKQVEIVSDVIPIIKVIDSEKTCHIAPLSDLLLMNMMTPPNLNVSELKFDLFIVGQVTDNQAFKDMEVMSPESVEALDVEKVMNHVLKES